MDTLYSTLANHIEGVSPKTLGDGGTSLLSHIQTLITLVPPTPKQARRLFDALISRKGSFEDDSSPVLRKTASLCGPWVDSSDSWYWRACGNCIQQDDPLTLDLLLSEVGAPRGLALSNSTLHMSKFEGLSLIALALSCRHDTRYLDIFKGYGADFNAGCFHKHGQDGVPLSYKPGAERTIALLERGARLGGVCSDGKPVWQKVFRLDMHLDEFAKLIRAMSELATKSQDLRDDLSACWRQLVPHFARYFSQIPYQYKHEVALGALAELAKTTQLSLESNPDDGTPSLIALWAKASLFNSISDKRERTFWATISTTVGLNQNWTGHIEPDVSDSVWGLLSEVKDHASHNFTADDISPFETPDLWRNFHTVITREAHEPWAWLAVSKLRAHMPPDIRNSLCLAVGKAFYQALCKDPASLSRKPTGGMSVLTQSLSGIPKDRMEFVDTELANLALSAHLLTGWHSKAAKRALDYVALNPPAWLDIPLILDSYSKCPRKLRGDELREMDANILSLNTQTGQKPKLGSRRL